MITWNKDWIQEHESVWGVFEKFKYANQINGKEFFYYFSENNKVNFTAKSVKYRFIENLKSMAKEKLSENFKIDMEELRDEIAGLSKSPLSKLSILNDSLCFCKNCISEGYHSKFHQYMFVANCPFHPEEQLTDKCPNCNNNFRKYDLGYTEQAYCCENCKFNILKNRNFSIIKKYWGIPKVIEDTYVLDLTNCSNSRDISAQFIFSTNLERSAINKPVYKLINERLLGVLTKNKSLPVFIENRHIFSPAYKKEYEENYKVGYVHRELLRDYYKDSMREPYTMLQINKFKTCNKIDLLNQLLDYELFKKSKAILKTVDRYIQRRIGHKINLNREMKKDSITDPYIEAYKNWKIACYGVFQNPYKVYTYLGIDEPIFTARNRDPFYQTQTYPSLSNSSILDRIIGDYKKEGYSFKFIANVFSKILFNFLFLKFQEYLCKSINPKNFIFQIYNLPPFTKLIERTEKGLLKISFINSFEIFNPDLSMVNNPSIKWINT